MPPTRKPMSTSARSQTQRLETIRKVSAGAASSIDRSLIPHLRHRPLHSRRGSSSRVIDSRRSGCRTSRPLSTIPQIGPRIPTSPCRTGTHELLGTGSRRRARRILRAAAKRPASRRRWPGWRSSRTATSSRRDRAADWLAERQAREGSVGVTATQANALLADQPGHSALARAIGDCRPNLCTRNFSGPSTGHSRNTARRTRSDRKLATIRRSSAGRGRPTPIPGSSRPQCSCSRSRPSASRSTRARARRCDCSSIALLPARRLQLRQHDRPRPGAAAARPADRHRHDGARRRSRRRPADRTLAQVSGTRTLSADTTTASLCYGLLGLAAHRPHTRRARQHWLQIAYRHVSTSCGSSLQTRARSRLAAMTELNPLVCD